MMLTYKNLENEPDKYLYLHKLGKINYDLICCVTLMQVNIKDSSDLNYLAQIAYVHINEALKYLNMDKTINVEEYLTDEFKKTSMYKTVSVEMDFGNNDSSNNSFIRKLRTGSVHYRPDPDAQKSEHEKALFLKYASELKRGLHEIENDFPRENNIEHKSMMVHLNMHVIENNVKQEKYAKTLIEIAKSLIVYVKQLQNALLEELEEN